MKYLIQNRLFKDGIKMFGNERYMTRGIKSEIPLELQLFM